MIQRQNCGLGQDRFTSERHSQWKRKLRFGTWNIKTINGKEVELIQEMKDRKMEILGLSEVKRKGNGMRRLQDGYILRYSGVGMDSRAKEGVGIITNERIETKVSGWEPINSRIMVVDLYLEINLSLFSYTPRLMTLTYWTKKNSMYNSADLNGRTGQNKRMALGCMGKHGEERTLNESGRRVIEFCIGNQLLIGNSFFPHKKVHKITYEAEGSDAKSVIDYFLYPQDIRNNIMDVKVIRGAELYTDHRLLVMDTRFRRPTKPKTKRFEAIKIREFKNEEKKKEYSGKVQEKLQAKTLDNMTVNNMWNTLKSILIETAEEVCGKMIVNTRKKRTNWWTEEVKEKVHGLIFK